MTVWIEPIKMVMISSLLWLGSSVIAILLSGTAERSFLLFAPAPKWPVFVLFALLWCISLKAGYWWVFQSGFYGSK